MSDRPNWMPLRQRLESTCLERNHPEIEKKQSRTRRQSEQREVRSIPNSAYVRKLYVLFVFPTNLEKRMMIIVHVSLL